MSAPSDDAGRPSVHGDATSPDQRSSLERPVGRLQPRWRQTLSALLANRLAAVSLVVLVLLVVAAALAPWLAPYGVNEVDVLRRYEPPSAAHWFGTDDLGRDLLSRVLVGSRASLQVGLVAVSISLVAGTLIGLIAGYRGGRIDTFLMRTMDVMFAFPVVLLAIAVVAILRPGLVNTMIAIGIVFTPIFARVVRGSVLAVREEVYITAVRSLGASDLRVIGRHVLPNVAAPLIVQTSLSLAFAILIEAALSYLGVGVQPPTPAWGYMLSQAQDISTMRRAWWMSVFPGLAIFVTVMAFNLVGDGLRDALDPRQRSVIESRGQASP